MRNILFACILVPIGILVTGIQAAWWLSPLWVVGILAYIGIDVKKSILIATASFGLVWLLTMLYWMSMDETEMIGRTSTLMGGISSSTFMLVTFLVGIITGALSGWLGGTLGLLLKNKNSIQQNG